jgi:hypothetical protein
MDGTSRTGMSASMSQRAENSNRTGSKAKVYSVRRDPNIDRKDILKDKNSQNKFKFVAGSTYKGDWRDNEKHGFGIEEMSNGNKYEGEWAGGRQHGMGTLWLKKGKLSLKQYAGNWAYGKKDGSGVHSFENGDVYSGEWAAGRRAGGGRMDFANGDYYIGQWEKDVQHGSGILSYANGNRYDGHWCDGVKEGPGKFYYAATNKVYEGEWVDDCPRCGEFREPTASESASIGNPTVFKHQFDLPEIMLKNSRGVLDCTTAATRLECSVKQGILESGLSEEALSHAESVFAELDSDNHGSVESRYLGSVFSALGVFITPEDLVVVMSQFSMDDVSDLSFPEVVEIASFLSQNR